MPHQIPLPDESALVATLRSAGCVFAEEEAALLLSAAGSPDELQLMLGRRVAGLPLEVVIGWADFCGLRIVLDEGVFVPRQRTAFLVRQAAALAAEGSVVLDLCCGSGAVGAAVAAVVGPIQLHSSDIEPAAVSCARRNVARAGGQVYQGDLFQPLPASLRGRVDVMVVNAPYVPTGAIGRMPPEARIHEPRIALDGGVDGLEVQRRVAAGAPGWLAPGGHLLVETSREQGQRSCRVLADQGLFARLVRNEESDATVVIGAKS